MSILKVNDIRRATTSSVALVFNDPVIITTGSISASALVGNIPGAVSLADNSIGKEKLTLDARNWVNILNKPSGLISSSNQIAGSISGSSIQVTNITGSGNVAILGYFSGSGTYLYDIPNTALNNSSITINGVATALGASRTLVTADISESTNLYYTDARVKSKINAEGVFSSSGQVNYQAVEGKFSVNTLGSDGNNSFTVSAGIFITGSTGIDITTDPANAKVTLKTVGGTVSSSTQVKANLPADTVSSSTQVKTFLPADTVSSSTQVKAFLPGGSVSSSTQTVANIVAQNINPAQITASGHIVPAVTDTIDLGSPTAKFRDLYLSGSTLYLGGLAIKDVGGTMVVATSGSSTPAPSSGSYTGSFTGSFNGTFPYASLTGIPSGIASGSAQVKDYLPTDTVSSSVQVKAFLPGGSVSASGQVDVRNTTGIATIATTGSNIFVGNQIISGSTTITGNLTVQGTSSVLYVTSSQLDVGSNRLTLNTTAILRYGGINVYDSGSITNQSGSLLWDSVNNVWLFVHSGTSNTSSIVITGPENTGALGNEAFLTTNLLPKAGVSGDHIVNSQISDNGTQVGIVGSLRVTGSITASAVSGALTGTFPYTGLTSIPSGIVSASTQVQPLLPAGTVSSSGQVDYNSITNKLSGVYSSSTQAVAAIASQTITPTVVNTTTITATNITASFISGAHTGTFPYASLTGVPSALVSSSTQIQPLLPAGTVSSSGQVSATATIGFTTGVEQVMKDNTVHSGSFLGTATTNNLSEGFTNLYYTDARVKTKLNTEAVHSGSSLGTATTTNLTEGTNLYFTNLRVLNALPVNTVSSSNQVIGFLPAGTLSSSTQVDLSQGFNTASRAVTASYALMSLGTTATTTDGLPQGSTNLYYNDSLVKTKLNTDNVHSGSFLGTATTTNLTEGINLYFTNARVVNALPAGTVSSSTQVSVLVPAGTVSSSGQVTISSTTGYSTFSSSLSTVDQNQQLEINALKSVTSSYAINSTIQSQLAGVYSSSTQAVAAIAGQTIAPSIINVTGAISGASIQTSGNIVTTTGNFIFKDAINSNTYAFRGLSGIITLDGGSQYPTGWNFQYGGSSTSALYINSSGNVGIGTSSPGVLLDISGTTPTARVIGTAGTTPKLTLASAGVSAWSFRTSGSDSSFRLDQDGTDRITVLSGGNVGINDTAPATKLVISNQGTIDTSTPGTTLYNLHFTGLSTNDYAQGITFNGGSTGAHAGLYVQGSGAYGTKMYFATTDSYAVGSKTRMMIDHSGNVGIGTTSPSYKLHVNGTSYFTDTLALGAGTNSVISWTAGYSDGTTLILRGPNSGSLILQPNIARTGIYISSLGYVGVGTSTPAQQLDVRGSARIGSGVSANDMSATNYVAISTATIGQSTGLEFFTNDGTYNPRAWITHTHSAGAQALTFNSIYSSGTGYANFNFLNGNVGIGTTSNHDGAKLEVRSGKIVAGTATSVGGPVILQGYYTDGALTVLGSEYSNGGPVLGYGVKPSTSAAASFLSATGINVPRGAYNISGLTHTWYGGGVQTVAVDSAVTMQTLMTLDSNVLRVNQDQARIHISSSVSTNTSYVYISNAGGTLYMGKENSAGSAFSTTPYASFINAADTYPLVFMVNATERARITNGNVFSTTGAVSASGAISGSKFKVGGGDDSSLSNGVIGAFNPSGLSRMQMFANASVGRLDFITVESLDFAITHNGVGKIRLKNAGDISLTTTTSVSGSLEVTGIVTGSGSSYRMVIPVGTNLYAT